MHWVKDFSILFMGMHSQSIGSFVSIKAGKIASDKNHEVVIQNCSFTEFVKMVICHMYQRIFQRLLTHCHPSVMMKYIEKPSSSSVHHSE